MKSGVNFVDIKLFMYCSPDGIFIPSGEQYSTIE